MKKTSKRTTTRQVIKQQKKLREHNAKLRKEKRKNPQKFKKSKKVKYSIALKHQVNFCFE